MIELSDLLSPKPPPPPPRTRAVYGAQSRGSHNSGGGHGDGTWIFSYADMITILMTFFILMLSISNVSSEKYEELQQAMSSDKSAKSSPTEKSVVVNKDLQKLASPNTVTLGGIPLDAVARKAAETGGDRFAQLAVGMRLLLESVNKDFITKESTQIAEFEGLKLEVAKVMKVAEGRSQVKNSGNEIILSLPSNEVFTDNGASIKPEAKAFLAKLLARAKSLNPEPRLHVECHASLYPPPGWRGPWNGQVARMLTVNQSSTLLNALKGGGFDPALVTVAPWGSDNVLAPEVDRFGKRDPGATMRNNRLIVVFERREIHPDASMRGGKESQP